MKNIQMTSPSRIALPISAALGQECARETAVVRDRSVFGGTDMGRTTGYLAVAFPGPDTWSPPI